MSVQTETENEAKGAAKATAERATRVSCCVMDILLVIPCSSAEASRAASGEQWYYTMGMAPSSAGWQVYSGELLMLAVSTS